jgi:allophanate hydrolase
MAETKLSTIERMQSLAIGDLRAAYRARRTTPTAVVRDVLARIAARGDDHVWISRVPDEQLRAAAAAVDPDAALAGIPFAVKDNIDVAGVPTTAGCPDFSYQPAESAVAVRRLLDAGALFVGKTNMDQFATGLSGTRSPYGACESIFGGGLISGGSSSGSAVAVAAGLVSFALGTDTAGSGRVPAALNGIVGVKPTRGLISTVGVVPACRRLDCVSVFATGVADAALIANVAAGPPVGPWDRAATPERGIEPAKIRLGVPELSTLDFEGDAATRDAFEAMISRAKAIVGELVAVRIEPLLEAGQLLYGGALVAERLTDLAAFFARRPDSVLPVTRQVIGSGAAYTATDVYRDLHRLAELRAVPTTFTIAALTEDPFGPNQVLGRYTQFVNLLDLAAVAVPADSTVDGRPAGVSVIGPAFSDATVAALAQRLMAPVNRPTKRDAFCVDPDSTVTVVPDPDTVRLVVVGKHLRGEVRHHELTDAGAQFAGSHRTAASYRLYHLPTGVPGLVRTGTGGAAIEVELWSLPVAAIGPLLAGVSAPLSVGWVRLADGTEHLGFLCEAYAAHSARDITEYGGWRAFRAGQPVSDPTAKEE